MSNATRPQRPGPLSKLPALFALGFCLTASACVVGQYGQFDSYGTAPPANQWQSVRLEDKSLAVRMPGQPEIETSSDTDFDGTEIHSTVGRYSGPGVIIGFSVRSAEGGFIDDPYERAVESATSDSDDDWKLRWEDMSEEPGFRAADRIIDSRENGASIRFHFVQGKTKLYTLFAAYPTARESECAWWVKEFFKSASFDPEQALIPLGDGRLSQEAWDFVYPPDRDFALELPGPALSTKPSERMVGLEAKSFAYSVHDPGKGIGFQVVVHEFGRGVPSEALAQAREETSNDLSVVEERFIHQRGFAGVDVILASDTTHLHAQYFVTTNRVYELLTWSPIETESEHEAARLRFLNSFRIL